MCGLNIGVFDHLDTTSPIDVDQRVDYTHRTLKGYSLKQYREFLIGCRQLTKELAGDEWNLGKLTGLLADDLCIWSKTNTTGYDGHEYLERDKCVNFERKL